MVKLLKRYLKNYTGKLLLAILFMLIFTFSTMALPTLSKSVIDKGAIAQSNDVIIRYAIIMLIDVAICAIAGILSNFFSSGVVMSSIRDMRNALFERVVYFSQEDEGKIGTASLISRQSKDIQTLQTAMVQMLMMMLQAPLMCIAGIVLALTTSKTLSWIIVILLPLAAIVMTMVIKLARPIFRANQIKIDRVNGVMREALTGMRVIRAFNREEYETDRFAAVSNDYTDNAKKGFRIMNTFLPLIIFFSNASNLLILGFGSQYMRDGLATYGAVQAYIQYTTMILASFMLASMFLMMLPNAQTAAERINEIWDVVSTIKEKEDAAAMPEVGNGSIEVEHVSYRFPGAAQNVLTDISFSAKAGQTVAIIGGTGSGKSTLLNVLCRNMDVTEGSVKIDGVDIRDVKFSDLRDHISIVPQKSFLFAGSIIDNVRFGKNDATDEEVQHVLDVSQSIEFVNEKEYGMYTYISQGGTNVSGGQKQRLAIARALIRKADVYIFDDSFSALDFRTDAKLRKELAGELTGAVTIIVAQRVSTIKNADRILVLEAGKIVGDGTHEELIASNKVYREIAMSQLSESEVKGA
ncbi:MAG: ABC transporter ATP-binding protein/permease [Lachnospiraceae bacterium]|nr:ABC transporter ATP-binding protein/permease [Lachnospiraceae bacterium]